MKNLLDNEFKRIEKELETLYSDKEIYQSLLEKTDETDHMYDWILTNAIRNQVKIDRQRDLLNHVEKLIIEELVS